ncbi:MAG TPA: porin [Nitrospirales bacterium]|jgi:phosphate-selective porin
MGYFKVRFRKVGRLWPAPVLAAGLTAVLMVAPVSAADPALKILLQKGIITQQEYDEAIKEAEQLSAPPAQSQSAIQKNDASVRTEKIASEQDNTVDLGKGIKFGYDRGLYTQFRDKFRLKIRIRGQFRFTDSAFNKNYNTVGDTKNFPSVSGTGTISGLRHAEDISELDVRRVRLVFEGFAFSPDITYFVQFRNDTNGSTTQPSTSRSTTQLYDAYVALGQLSWANLKVGQYRTHFGRQEFVSSALLQFVDRGFVAEAFVPNGIDRRDQGITVFSDPAKHRFNYNMGVFNGVGINLTRLGLNSPSNANELMYVGRVTADVLGKPGYPEGDLAFSATPQFGVGASYGYNAGLQTNTTGIGSNNQVSTAIASLGNGRLLNQGVVNLGTSGIEAVFKYKGLSLQAEGFVRNVDTRDHSKRIGNATGYYVQGGYFLVPRAIEVVGRYSYMDPDSMRTQDTITSAVGGLNWYLSGHEHKLQLDFGVITTRLSAADTGTGAVSLIENRGRLQYTIVF